MSATYEVAGLGEIVLSNVCFVSELKEKEGEYSFFVEMVNGKKYTVKFDDYAKARSERRTIVSRA